MKTLTQAGFRRKSQKKEADYRSAYLKKGAFKERSCVYISQKIHTTVSRIVKVISDSDITVGGYIDSILMEHLAAHRDEIIELYNRELAKNTGNSLMDF
jgi:hypothetical protein